jgi:hypothetical protein
VGDDCRAIFGAVEVADGLPYSIHHARSRWIAFVRSRTRRCRRSSSRANAPHELRASAGLNSAVSQRSLGDCDLIGILGRCHDVPTRLAMAPGRQVDHFVVCRSQ